MGRHRLYPMPYLSKLGSGMRRSWLMTAVPKNTSPMAAPCTCAQGRMVQVEGGLVVGAERRGGKLGRQRAEVVGR